MSSETILDTIMANRRKQVDALKARIPLRILSERAFAAREKRVPVDFAAALKNPGLSVIAEVKKASPSKGVIQPDFRPVEIARAYAHAGADAISVLTEETYFQGSGEILKQVRDAVELPVLRKDFIFDEWQLCEACVLGADAVLLIASVLNVFELKKLMAVAEMLGMQCLVEVRSERQALDALHVGARVVGVNNRNLATFDVDLSVSAKFRHLFPSDVVFVSESGITTSADMERAANLGADAVLIGETLMRASNIEEKLRELRAFVHD